LNLAFNVIVEQEKNEVPVRDDLAENWYLLVP
jgi:hypothetical protein